MKFCINIGDGTYFHSFSEDGYNVVKSLHNATRVQGKKAADEIVSTLHRIYKITAYRFEI